MTDMNNRSMNDNNENRNNDPKERMRKKVKKAAGIALCAVLAGGLAAGSFEGVNALTGWNSSSVEAASSNKENTTLLQTKSNKKDKSDSSDESDSSKTKGSLDVSDTAADWQFFCIYAGGCGCISCDVCTGQKKHLSENISCSDIFFYPLACGCNGRQTG